MTLTSPWPLHADDYRADDGIQLSPAEVYNYLIRVMYNRRNKFDPLWNSLVVGGLDASSGSPILGMVGMIGTHYTDSHVTTGGRRWRRLCAPCGVILLMAFLLSCRPLPS